MKQLWAPWRMEYILDDKQDDCFLCRIIAERDDEARHVLTRRSHCLALLNRYPYNNGHLMIAPYTHVPSLSRMAPAARAEMLDLAAELSDVLAVEMNAQGFNMGINQGAVAGAGLESHVHLHLVPRWQGDTNFMPVFADTKIIPQELDRLTAQLRQALTTREPESS